MSTKASVTNRLDAERIEALIDTRFPQIHAGGRSLIVEEAGQRGVRVRLLHHQRHTRPGGTISGAAMFMLADFAVYVAIIAALGEMGLRGRHDHQTRAGRSDRRGAPHPPRPAARRRQG